MRAEVGARGGPLLADPAHRRVLQDLLYGCQPGADRGDDHRRVYHGGYFLDHAVMPHAHRFLVADDISMW